MRCTLTRLAAVVVPAALLLLLAGAPVWAAAPEPPPAVNDLSTVINNIRYWVMSIIGAVATLFLCLGGARYLLAGGDPTEIERAKSAFKSAAKGYALALLSPVILTILNSILVR